jgi:hypothetical protein
MTLRALSFAVLNPVELQYGKLTAKLRHSLYGPEPDAVVL